MWTENDEEDWIHKVREQLSKETEGMTPEERARYYEEVASKCPVKLRSVKRCSDAEKPAA